MTGGTSELEGRPEGPGRPMEGAGASK